MGIPQAIVPDQGKEFNNSLDTELAKVLGVTRRFATPYHLQVCSFLVFRGVADDGKLLPFDISTGLVRVPFFVAREAIR